MKELAGQFDLLGFDLMGLDNLVYFSGSDILPPPVDCPGDVCTGGCQNGCWQCKPDCQIGSKG